jgi:putative spermidine/putrescine transport system ATP-binding protein
MASTTPTTDTAMQIDADGEAAADIELRGLTKRYGDVTAVDGIDLTVKRGEFFTFLGPSGSGKTTTLRLIAGFELPDEGEVLLRGEDVAQQPPFARDVNTVFQDYALFPHMTVQENVEYGLRVKKVSKAERKERAAEALAMVRLDTHGPDRPGGCAVRGLRAPRERVRRGFRGRLERVGA